MGRGVGGEVASCRDQAGALSSAPACTKRALAGTPHRVTQGTEAGSGPVWDCRRHPGPARCRGARPDEPAYAVACSARKSEQSWKMKKPGPKTGLQSTYSAAQVSTPVYREATYPVAQNCLLYTRLRGRGLPVQTVWQRQNEVYPLAQVSTHIGRKTTQSMRVSTLYSNRILFSSATAKNIFEWAGRAVRCKRPLCDFSGPSL